MKKYLKLMRIKHWIKNCLVFTALFFGGNIFDVYDLFRCIVAFFIYSLASSCVYIINDISDIEKDRKHPVKCKRPLASGEVSVQAARILLLSLLLLIAGMNYFLLNTPISWVIIIVYIAINFVYSKGAKSIALLDLVILVTGYILRVYFGAIATGIAVSSWLYLTVIFMSFYLSLGKRRNELESIGNESRRVLNFYTKNFLDKNMYMCLGLTIMCYAWWCETVNSSRGNSKMLITVPLVVIICLKYSLNVESSTSDGDPMNIILGDKWLIGLVVLYVALLFCFLYF